jgi:hypothetical protein
MPGSGRTSAEMFHPQLTPARQLPVPYAPVKHPQRTFRTANPPGTWDGRDRHLHRKTRPSDRTAVTSMTFPSNRPSFVARYRGSPVVCAARSAGAMIKSAIVRPSPGPWCSRMFARRRR